MEPVTHILTGACLARTGFNRRAAYATLTMAVAAELPDIDTLWGLRGPVEVFTHHRGITHSFVGLPLEAALVVGAVYGLHRWRIKRAAAAGPADTLRAAGGLIKTAGPLTRTAEPLTKAPVRWGVLYGLAILALLSHLLLDFTNNYGIRPFFPFNAHWFAGSIVFIFDPLIFLFLLSGLVMPSLFALISAEIGAHKERFRGRGWAVAALLGVLGIWTLRTVEHNKAVGLAMEQTISQPTPTVGVRTDPDMDAPLDAETGGGAVTVPDRFQMSAETTPVYLSAQRALASPDPFSPFHWTAATDFGPVYQRAKIDTLAGSVSPEGTLEPKPDRSAAVLAAEASPLGRAYVDWSPMPFVSVSVAENAGVPGEASATMVTFRDPRFLIDFPLLSTAGRTALVGVVSLDDANRVIGETMDGRVER